MALPKGLLGTAIGYAVGLWPQLTTFLEDGHIPPSTTTSPRTPSGPSSPDAYFFPSAGYHAYAARGRAPRGLPGKRA